MTQIAFLNLNGIDLSNLWTPNKYYIHAGMIKLRKLKKIKNFLDTLHDVKCFLKSKRGQFQSFIDS